MNRNVGAPAGGQRRRPGRLASSVFYEQAMKLQAFTQNLAARYQDWGLPSVQPRSDRYHGVVRAVRGMTTPNVLQLLNEAVAYLEAGEVYCEIGCFQGATLIGALLGHPGCPAYAADNFCEFDPQGQNHAALQANLAAYGLEKQVLFHNQEAEDFLATLRKTQVKVGVYLYDGAHDYRSQLMGLLLAVPLLAEHALLVVDDGNWPAVKQATWDFLAARPEAHLLFDLPTPGNCHPTFWNGLMVLGWDAQGRTGYDRAAHKQARQGALLESLYVLQGVNLKAENGGIRLTRTE
jgi:protein O-GlcNAc transferase